MTQLQKLVYVASFDTPAEARIAGSWLEANGIECQYRDEEVVAMQWHLGIAFGGAKIFVSEDDRNRAEELLQNQAASEPIESDVWSESDEEAIQAENLLGDADSEADSEFENENQLADRAYRSAIFSFLYFPPLIIYSIWSFVRGAQQFPNLSAPSRKKMFLSGLVYAIIGVFLLCLLLAFLGF